MAAGRISYVYGLKGSCLSVDTACSSSLVGAHYGASDMLLRQCQRSLIAGVNLTLNPHKTSAFAVTGISHGYCQKATCRSLRILLNPPYCLQYVLVKCPSNSKAWCL